MYVRPPADELFHYGVKGMKWGVRRAEKRAARATKKVEKNLTRSGAEAGRARYIQQQANRKAREELRVAKQNEATAKKYAAEGKKIRSGIARYVSNLGKQSAKEIRQQGIEDAKFYLERSERYKEKASKIATKKNVSLGENRVNQLLRSGRKSGYNLEREFDRSMTTMYGEDWRHS